MSRRAGFIRAAVIVVVIAIVAIVVAATKPMWFAPAAGPGERQATYLEYMRQVAPGIPEGAAVQFGWDACRAVNSGKASVAEAEEIVASDTQMPAAARSQLVVAAINVLCPNGEGAE